MRADFQPSEPDVVLEEPAKSDATPRPGWRHALAAGLFYSGALRIARIISRSYELRRSPRSKRISLRRARVGKYAILCYHRVGVGGVPLFSELPPEVFEAQMRFLRRHYRIVSLDQLCDELENPNGARQSIAITFDDGYADLFNHAFPVLKQYRIPATIFLPVASIEAGLPPWYDRIFLALKVFIGDRFDILLDRPRGFRLSSHEARMEAASEIIEYLRSIPDARRKQYCSSIEGRVILPERELTGRMLSWEQVQAMSDAGIQFGSHTMTHPAIGQLTVEEIDRELSDSKRILEQRIGSPVRHFAFPFGRKGDCGLQAGPILTSCGYRSGVTMIMGINSPGQNLYALHRVACCDERVFPMFAAKLTQLFFSAEITNPQTTDTLPGGTQGNPSELTGKGNMRASNA